MYAQCYILHGQRFDSDVANGALATSVRGTCEIKKKKITSAHN